jgi:hypothetical protein
MPDVRSLPLGVVLICGEPRKVSSNQFDLSFVAAREIVLAVQFNSPEEVKYPFEQIAW